MGSLLGNTRRRFPGLPSQLGPTMAAPLPCKHHENIALAFCVLTCANELEDIVTALIARRVIEALLSARYPREADLKILTGYFQ
jgi:hypothetical protein